MCSSVVSSVTRSKVNGVWIVVRSVVILRLNTDYAYLFRTDLFVFVGMEFIFLMVVSVSFLYFEETMRRRDFVKCVRAYMRECACV